MTCVCVRDRELGIMALAPCSICNGTGVVPPAEPRDPLAGVVCTEARTADGHLKAWQPMPGSIWYASHAADGIVQRYPDAPGLAKRSDSRAGRYVERHGYESWELDALSPPVIDALIQDAIDELIDRDLWAEDEAREEQDRQAIREMAERFRAEADAR